MQAHRATALASPHAQAAPGTDGHRQSRALARMEAEKPAKFPFSFGHKKASPGLRKQQPTLGLQPAKASESQASYTQTAVSPVSPAAESHGSSLFRRNRLRKGSKESNERRSPPHGGDDGDDRNGQRAPFEPESPVSFSARARESADAHADGPVTPTTPDHDAAAGREEKDRGGFLGGFGRQRSNGRDNRDNRETRGSRVSQARNKHSSPRKAVEMTPTAQSTSTVAADEEASFRETSPLHQSPRSVTFEARPPPRTPSPGPSVDAATVPGPPRPASDAQRGTTTHAGTDEHVPHQERPRTQQQQPPPPPPPKQEPERAPSPPPTDPGDHHRVAALEAALVGSQKNEQELSAQLVAAHKQLADYVDLLQKRDASLAEQEALLAQERARVERLRVRLQEQVEAQAAQRAGGGAAMGESNGGGGGDLGSSLIYQSGLASGTQLPESTLVQRWKLLHWQIGQCVESRIAALLATPAAWQAVPPRRAPLLRQLTPAFARFLQIDDGSGGSGGDPARPAHLAMAAVWSFLAANVFGGQRQASPMLWAGQMAEPLGRIELSVLRRRSRDPAFHLWRAQTAAFVRSLFRGATPEDQAAAAAAYGEAATQQLALDVGYFLEPGSPAAGRGVSDGLWQQLAIIVDTATALDADLSQQRAWYYVHYPTAEAGGQRHGMAFDPAAMEDVAAARGSASDASGSGEDGEDGKDGGDGRGATGLTDVPVQLVVRPALVKAGNGRGAAYDQVVVVEPSLVCRAPRPSRAGQR